MSEDTKDLIIEKVASIPAIWDKSHEHHHNRYVLEKHWKVISSAARLPGKNNKRSGKPRLFGCVYASIRRCFNIAGWARRIDNIFQDFPTGRG